MSTPTLALTLFPLSAAYRTRFETRLGYAPDYCLVSDLRHGGWKNLVRWLLRSRYRRVLLPYEVEEAISVMPLMQLIAAAHKCPEIFLCSPDLEIVPVGPGALVAGGLGLLAASWEGRQARRQSLRAATSALASPPARPPHITGGHRVLYLKNNLWFGLRAGGSVGHVAGVVNGLAALGHDVTFLSPEAPRYLDSRVRAEKVPMFRHYAVPAEANLFRIQRRSEKAALEIARGLRPTLIYQRLSLGDWTGVQVAEKLGVPLVVEYNGSELWVARHWGGNTRYAVEMEAAEEAMLRRADLVFTISEPLRDELLARGIPSSKIDWYPNCVDPQQFDPGRFSVAERKEIRTRLGAADADCVFMFVGTFGLWHGAEVFAQAVARLSADAAWMQRRRPRFVFVGDGKTRARCAAIVAESPAADHTVFTGLVPQHEAPSYLFAADAYISPHVPNADGSKFFGSPTKLFEYMAMGRPIVASALDQIAEVLADGRTAVMVRPGDVEDLMRGIRRVADDPLGAEQLGRAARNEVLAKYTWKTHVTRILEALERSRRPST